MKRCVFCGEWLIDRADRKNGRTVIIKAKDDVCAKASCQRKAKRGGSR